MMTLKMAILAIMIGSSAVPLHRGDINKAFERPQVSEVINYAVSDQMLSNDFIPVHKDTSALGTRKPAHVNAAPVEKVVPVKHMAPARPEINKDKTYDQCMREAFERIYEEVNRMLDELVDGREEQF